MPEYPMFRSYQNPELDYSAPMCDAAEALKRYCPLCGAKAGQNCGYPVGHIFHGQPRPRPHADRHFPFKTGNQLVTKESYLKRKTVTIAIDADLWDKGMQVVGAEGILRSFEAALAAAIDYRLWMEDVQIKREAADVD